MIGMLRNAIEQQGIVQESTKKKIPMERKCYRNITVYQLKLLNVVVFLFFNYFSLKYVKSNDKYLF